MSNLGTFDITPEQWEVSDGNNKMVPSGQQLMLKCFCNEKARISTGSI
jgi:hypothetical protein